MTRPQSATIRLLIVDDHEMVRVGLRTLLKRSSNIEIAGEAAGVAAGVAEAARLTPDVVLMDVRLPDGSGIDACRQIRARHPRTRVLFVTACADEDAVLAAVLAGADGYVLKEIGGEALVSAIEAVAEGGSILDAGVTRGVLERARSLSAPAAKPADAFLSPQEQRVLALVAEGKTNKEIGAALGLSYKTVKNYLSNVFQKIQVTHRSEAAAFFVRGHKR